MALSRHPMRPPTHIWPLLFLAACSESQPSRTEVMLVIDSNLSVPSELDAIDIEASSPAATTRKVASSLQRPSDLPGTIGLLYPGGALGPFHVVVHGKLGNARILTREAEFSFVKGATLTLSMNLLRSCVDVACPSGKTCSERGCVSPRVPATDLPPWTGRGLGLPESSVGDSGVGSGEGDAQVDAPCVAASETCNGLDDDCDSKVDEDFDLQRDSDHCGKCDTVCALDNADSTCSGGKCEISQCAPGFADCDRNATTGCEADLESDATCGDCDNRCVGQRHCCSDYCSVDCP